MVPLRVAFVMEQALGHVTHYRNLREFTDQQPDIAPVWLPIPFDVHGLEKLVPMLRNNWSVRASWRARRALEVARARGVLDAAVFHTQVTSLFSVGMMATIPTVISLDATPINYDSVGEHYGHRAASSSFVDRRKFELNRRAFHAAAGLVTWSEWARRSLVDDYDVDSARVRVIAPGAAPSYFDIGGSRRATPDDGSRPVKILFVGADFDRKGGPLLLQWMNQAQPLNCELHLVTQSNVPAQPNVIVHRGLQANSLMLRQLFAEADIFVLPTHADCLGVALMEAAAAGLPVVTTDVGALREAVQHDESGYVVPAGNARALSATLSALIDDTERRQRMGRAAYALARQRFDAARNNRLLLDFVAEQVEARQISSPAA